METKDKIAACNICLLAEGMKVCKSCAFNPARLLPKPTPEQLETITHKELYKEIKS